MRLIDAVMKRLIRSTTDVVRGQWEKYIDWWYRCSVCGSKWQEQWIIHDMFHYCPNCGAKMDEVGE